MPTAPTEATALWTRLAQPESAFAAIVGLLSQGGAGYLTPVWAGPDGANGASFATFIAGALAGE